MISEGNNEVFPLFDFLYNAYMHTIYIHTQAIGSQKIFWVHVQGKITSSKYHEDSHEQGGK